MISILCVCKNSNYYKLPGLDLYDTYRNAYTFAGLNKLIAHPPCAQWSKLRSFAKENKEEKDLAMFCLHKVKQNGGILEHPAGSQFWKVANVSRSNIISINQHWFGFPAQKRTWLYFHDVKPLAYPLSFNTPTKTVSDMHSTARSLQPLSFCNYLVNCINASNQ